MTATPVRRALLSVWDKTGLIPFAQRLAALGVELVSTGGTSRALKEAGLAVVDVSDITQFPEMLDGRVKTLHPGVHGGLLADLAKPEHVAALEAHGIGPIGLLVSNLYPFENAIESGRVSGRPRGTDRRRRPVDDARRGEELRPRGPRRRPGRLRHRRRRAGGRRHRRWRCAAGWRPRRSPGSRPTMPPSRPGWPRRARRTTSRSITACGPRSAASASPRCATARTRTRAAAFYRAAGGGGIASARIVQGKALSYNNVADGDAALSAVADFGDDVAAVVVKHANPCGIAIAGDLAEAYERARLCDPVSAFGGVVALSRPLDKATAEKIAAIFTEVVIAPGATDEAMAVLATKPNVRLLLVDGLPAISGTMVRTVGGGLLVQSADDGRVARDAMTVATQRAPTESEWADLAFAWRAVKHVKSNAIVYAKGQATVGIGAGQMSRVDSARIAAWKAADAAKEAGEAESRTMGSVAASDAFFPFADGLETIVAAGATAVIQPGGSRRDDEVIAAADAAGIAMVMTGMRHFRH